MPAGAGGATALAGRRERAAARARLCLSCDHRPQPAAGDGAWARRAPARPADRRDRAAERGVFRLHAAGLDRGRYPRGRLARPARRGAAPARSRRRRGAFALQPAARAADAADPAGDGQPAGQYRCASDRTADQPAPGRRCRCRADHARRGGARLPPRAQRAAGPARRRRHALPDGQGDGRQGRDLERRARDRAARPYSFRHRPGTARLAGARRRAQHARARRASARRAARLGGEAGRQGWAARLGGEAGRRGWAARLGAGSGAGVARRRCGGGRWQRVSFRPGNLWPGVCRPAAAPPPDRRGGAGARTSRRPRRTRVR